MSVLLAFLTALSAVGADQPPNYETHSAESQDQPPPFVIDQPTLDALDDWINGTKNSPGNSDSGQPGNERNETGVGGGPGNSKAGGAVSRAGGKRPSPLDDWIGAQRKESGSSNLGRNSETFGTSLQGGALQGGSGRSRMGSFPSQLDAEFPFGKSANTQDAGSNASSDSQWKWQRDNGVISVGRRPDGTREVAPEKYILWKVDKDGEKGPKRVYSNWDDFLRARDAINASPDSRAYTKEFKSSEEAAKWMEDTAKQDAKEEADRIAKQEADRIAKEKADPEARAQAELQSKLDKLDALQAELTKAVAEHRRAWESVATSLYENEQELRSQIKRAGEIGARVTNNGNTYTLITDPRNSAHRALAAQWERGNQDYRRLKGEEERLREKQDRLNRQQDQLDRERKKLLSQSKISPGGVIGSDGWRTLPDGKRMPPPTIFQEHK